MSDDKKPWKEKVEYVKSLHKKTVQDFKDIKEQVSNQDDKKIAQDIEEQKKYAFPLCFNPRSDLTSIFPLSTSCRFFKAKVEEFKEKKDEIKYSWWRRTKSKARDTYIDTRTKISKATYTHRLYLSYTLILLAAGTQLRGFN